MQQETSILDADKENELKSFTMRKHTQMLGIMLSRVNANFGEKTEFDR